MKVTITSRHFEASEKLQQFARDEIARLQKYFDGDISGEIILEENHNLKLVELRLNALGKMLPAKLEGSDFYKLIPKAVEKVEKQLKSVKDKIYYRR